jgi:hypothetical protein
VVNGIVELIRAQTIDPETEKTTCAINKESSKSMVSQRRSSWDGRYRDLASLKLPGPAVVIDVRKGSEHEPPLVWNLAIELDDFVWEMELQQIYRWRMLKHCLALFKLSPLPTNVDLTTCDYILSDPRGTGKELQGRDELIKALEEEIDLVRANRAGAIHDREQRFPTEAEVDSNRPTVSVCFIADAEDTNSLNSAATYAQWLKQASQHNDQPWDEQTEQQWDWQRPVIKTIVMCFNVDPHTHSPQMFAKHFQYANIPQALDKTVLLYRYGDNSVRITNEMQAHQVELILYVLLLSGWEMLDAHASQQPELFRRADGELIECWPLDLIGISSLEYSARWGTRWLDYGLVARISQKLLNTTPNQLVETQELSDHSAWLAWQDAIERFAREELEAVFPSLLVLNKLEEFFAPSHATKRAISPPDDWQNLAQRYPQLVEALSTIPAIIRQVQRDQLPRTQEIFTKIRASWQGLLAQTTQLPAALLLPVVIGGSQPYQLDPQGLLLRAQQSMIVLDHAIAKIDEVAQNPPDLVAGRDRTEALARRLQLQSRSSRFRKKQVLYEQSQQDLTKQILQDFTKVRGVIIAQIKLALLESAELYNPEGKASNYSLRLQQVIKVLRSAAADAQSMQDKAYDRLQLSLSQVQPSSVRGSIRLDLRSRADLLDWAALNAASDQLTEDFAKPDSLLPLLGYCLLSLLSGADPNLLLPQLHNRPRPQVPIPLGQSRQTQSEKQAELDRQEEKRTIQELGTLLSAVLLSSKQVQIPTTRIQTLVKRYLELVKNLDGEPTTFTNIIEHLQREGRPRQAGQGQRDSLTDFAVRRQEPFEVLLSAWVNSEYIDRPEFNQMLAQNALFTRMTHEQAASDAIFTDLRQRNILLGDIAPLYRRKSAYLLVPGNNSKQFMQEIDTVHMRDYLQTFSFPDIEKMIYLRVYHIAYPRDNLALPGPEDDFPPGFSPE